MSNQAKPALTDEQTTAVRNLINESKTDIVDAVKTAIKENQDKIKTDATADIKKAVEEHHQVVIAKVMPGTGRDTKGESKKFKVMLALIPVAATVGLGFYVARKVDQSKQEITTRLAIQEEFYKRKLATYEKTYAQMAEFNQALNSLRVDPDSVEAGMKAFQSMAEFDKFRRSNALYIRSDVMTELGNVWEAAANVVNDPKSAKKNPLTEKITAVEKLIENDLQVNSVGRISDVLNKGQ
jgi:hypothetical protein